MQLITPFRLLALVCALWSFIPLRANPKEPIETKQFSSPSVSFVENRGQVIDQFRKQRADIDFKLSTPGMNVFVGDGQIHYMWYKTPPRPRAAKPVDPKQRPLPSQELKEEPVETYRLDVVLVGANKNAELVWEDQQRYYENHIYDYFEGTVHSYRKATYKNVYPNIDWVLYIQNDQLKYDFVVNPGGNPKDIKLQYKGATAISINNSNVTATTPYGSITEQAPYTYDAVTKAKIASSFALNGSTQSFNVTGSSKNGIVIDPALGWATYYGGSSGDEVVGVTSNSAGDAYICGSTASTNNIVTTGAAQSSITGSSDAFIAVFNAAGQRLWGTYFGGNGIDGLNNIEFDGAGNIYGCGTTWSSTGIATTGAFQTSYSGGVDHMLIKFNSSGARIWGTYFGGSGGEAHAKMICDTAGNIYMVGQTSSTTGIASSTSVHQSSIAGPTNDIDVFLAKFNSSGARQWSTYVGGTDWDMVYDVDLDTSGNVYFVGATYSASGFGTSGTFLPTNTRVPANDLTIGYLCKFNSSGTQVWGTYIGESQPVVDFGAMMVLGLEIDKSNNIYICGRTSVDSFFATTGLKTVKSDYHEGFIAKFDVLGARNWATFVGGSNSPGWDEGVSDICVGSNGRIYGTGYGTAGGLATTGAWKSSTASMFDIDYFLAELDTAGVLKFASLFGGADMELTSGDAMSFDFTSGGISASPNGPVYFSVYRTYSTSGIATTGAHQTTHGGGDIDGAWAACCPIQQ